jgi:hypothetical protein
LRERAHDVLLCEAVIDWSDQQDTPPDIGEISVSTHSDLQFPNFSKLLVEAIDRLKKEGATPLSTMEQVVVGFITAEEDKDTSIGERIVYELDFLKLPKWVALITWLSPFGICSHHPRMILRIANYLLGYTRSEEEHKLPRLMRKEFGI